MHLNFITKICGCGGIGRRARLRIWCPTTCRFDSCHPHQQKSLFCLPTKGTFLNDVFRFAERDALLVRDVRLRRVMRLRAWVEHITSLLRSKSITVQQHNITCPLGQTSLAFPLALPRKIFYTFVERRFGFI